MNLEKHLQQLLNQEYCQLMIDRLRYSIEISCFQLNSHYSKRINPFGDNRMIINGSCSKNQSIDINRMIINGSCAKDQSMDINRMIINGSYVKN